MGNTAFERQTARLFGFFRRLYHRRLRPQYPQFGNQYDFSIQGNAFDGSSEPGIVWVMQDINGNGLPDDEWYELKGSEAGKDETIRNFKVTYYRPEGKKMDVQWISLTEETAG